jgi:hypothetical protein
MRKTTMRKTTMMMTTMRTTMTRVMARTASVPLMQTRLFYFVEKMSLSADVNEDENGDENGNVSRIS